MKFPDLTPETHPVGWRMRRPVGHLAKYVWHIRGHVDGNLIVRHWRGAHYGWAYEVVTPMEVSIWGDHVHFTRR